MGANDIPLWMKELEVWEVAVVIFVCWFIISRVIKSIPLIKRNIEIFENLTILPDINDKVNAIDISIASLPELKAKVLKMEAEIATINERLAKLDTLLEPSLVTINLPERNNAE